MKRTLLTAVLLVGLTVCTAHSRDAAGSAFGTLATAQSLGQGVGSLGFGVGIADATSFVGQFSYGLSQYTDGRLKLGLIDPDHGDTKITFGADFKWQFWNVSPNTTHPFDFGVGAFFEFVDYDFGSVFQVGGQLIASYPIRMRNGTTLSPYGRFNARLESFSSDTIGGDDDSNLEVGLNGGVKWDVTRDIGLFGEFQLDGNDGVFFGIDFIVM
jgi:hypothetical protein